MTNSANVVFLPCYHCYCCSDCSKRLEKASGTDNKGRLLCPFCRQTIETMVNLDKVLFRGEVGGGRGVALVLLALLALGVGGGGGWERSGSG